MTTAKRYKTGECPVGDDDAEVTPVPIPNTEVKLCGADDTWRAAARESRKSPAKTKSNPLGCFFVLAGGENGKLKIEN